MTAKAVVTVTVEIAISEVWNQHDSLHKVYRDATTIALRRVEHSQLGTVRHVKVEAIITESEEQELPPGPVS